MRVRVSPGQGYGPALTSIDPTVYGVRVQQTTMNQVVGFNLRLARQLRGLTQEQAAQALARQQRGKPWSKATWSAAEHSIDGQVVRQFTADDLVDFSLVFDLPPDWFLYPPGSGHEPVEILATSQPDDAEEYGLVS